MADFGSPASEGFPSHQRDRSGSMSLANSANNPPPASDGGAAVDNTSNPRQSYDGEGEGAPPSEAPLGLGQVGSPQFGGNAEQDAQVTDVLASSIGIATLLNRLKQSIASAKEFALFLKKRSVLEEEHAQGLRKLSRMTQESMRRPDHRQGTFTFAYDEMMHTHERMAENGVQFASSLHQMHDDLIELATIAERNRKSWKANGLSAEQKVADMEQAMRKSKAKYDSLSEDYERAKQGESRQTGKMFGALKAHKSAAQHEEDLLKKVQAADQTYHGHVQALQNEKAQLESTTRPEAVKALQDLIRETDSGTSLQMQKFASFNEKLLLSNGLSISPIRGSGADPTQPRSLREAVSSIDNDKDLKSFIAGAHRNLPASTGEVKYERNPVLNPQPSPLSQPHVSSQPPTSQNPPGSSFSNNQPFSMSSRTSTAGAGAPPTSSGQAAPAELDGPPRIPSPDGALPTFSQPHSRSFSQSNMPPPPSGPPGQHQQQYSNRNSMLPAQRFGTGGSISSSGPPQLGALPFQSGQTSPPPQQPTGPYQSPHERQDSGGAGLGQGPGPAPTGRTPPPFGVASQGPPPPGPPANAASSKPVFGLPLHRLYERDGLAVPMVVYQCIQAVDLFGLGLEGIYRQSGSMAHIHKLKNMFDTESSNPALDFRNPENFYHDVNSVTGLLKQFFRDLPDPLLTMEHHDSFVAAAKHDDDTVRRDSLHAIINSLPDPNYATLRALTLHLYRVMDNSHVNRMNSHNLAVIFGPTLMGTDPSTAISDAGWQIKVIDTILQNTYQIFDED